jgi:hypothetical protein
LITGVGLLYQRNQSTRPKAPWLRFALGFALVAAGVVSWDLARAQRPGFWVQGLISYGGLPPAEPTTLAERAADWLQLAGSFWASPLFNALLLVLLALWLAGGWARWWPGLSPVDVVLATFIVGFLILHWCLGFQVWDRYLLPLVPLVALLAARALVTMGDALRPAWRRAYPAAMAVVIVLLLAQPIWRAAHNQLPLGGDHGAYDGIDELAAYVRGYAPVGAVLYHHWLGYHYRFYLYGAPLRLHWYPDPADLVRDATVYRREPRFIAFPSWRDSTPQRVALAAAGIQLQPVYETARRDGTVSFRLYRLEGP